MNKNILFGYIGLFLILIQCQEDLDKKHGSNGTADLSISSGIASGYVINTANMGSDTSLNSGTANTSSSTSSNSTASSSGSTSTASNTSAQVISNSIPIRTTSTTTTAMITTTTTITATSNNTHPLITNGSFEIGSWTNNSGKGYMIVQPPQYAAVITGWTVGGVSVDWVSNSFWLANDGAYSIDLSGNGPGTISQTLTTSPGTTYDITFEYTGDVVCAPTIKHFTVSAGSTSKQYTFDTTGVSVKALKWITETFTFTASSNSTILTFTSNDNSTCGAVIDNVR